MVLPMPLYLCWAYLANAATRLGCAPVAHMAASTVMDHFLVRTPQRPLWEAHPGDAESLHRAHADKAAWPLLRAVVHVMFLWVSKLAAPALEMPPKDQKTPYLEDQVTRIRAARRLGIAMQASRTAEARHFLPCAFSPPAASLFAPLASPKCRGMSQIASMLGDAGLMMEGAIRMNNLVAPLLALSDKSPMLVKTLASCHMVVQVSTRCDTCWLTAKP